jgi:hypothetical protein
MKLRKTPTKHGLEGVAIHALFVVLFFLGCGLWFGFDRFNRCGVGTTLSFLDCDKLASLCISSYLSCSHNVYV